MTEEMRYVNLPAGAKHTHAGEDHYGPKRILLPKADAESLAQMIRLDREETREKASARAKLLTGQADDR